MVNAPVMGGIPPPIKCISRVTDTLPDQLPLEGLSRALSGRKRTHTGEFLRGKGH